LIESISLQKKKAVTEKRKKKKRERKQLITFRRVSGGVRRLNLCKANEATEMTEQQNNKCTSQTM